MKTCTRKHTANTHKNVMYACMHMHTHGARMMEQYEKMQSTRQTQLMTLNLNTFLHLYACMYVVPAAKHFSTAMSSFRSVSLHVFFSLPRYVCAAHAALMKRFHKLNYWKTTTAANKNELDSTRLASDRQVHVLYELHSSVRVPSYRCI